MAARLLSGTMALFIVPMVGKYVPTVISKRRNAMKVPVSDEENVINANATVAMART